MLRAERAGALKDIKTYKVLIDTISLLHYSVGRNGTSVLSGVCGVTARCYSGEISRANLHRSSRIDLFRFDELRSTRSGADMARDYGKYTKKSARPSVPQYGSTCK